MTRLEKLDALREKVCEGFQVLADHISEKRGIIWDHPSSELWQQIVVAALDADPANDGPEVKIIRGEKSKFVPIDVRRLVCPLDANNCLDKHQGF